METPGGGDGSRSGSVRTCFMRRRSAVVHGEGDNMTAAMRNDGFKGTATQEHDGCDHTSTNAPDPIRTPQLSALGLE